MERFKSPSLDGKVSVKYWRRIVNFSHPAMEGIFRRAAGIRKRLPRKAAIPDQN